MIEAPRIVALLDSMWGGTGEAVKWFRIDPDNFSGRRLYRLCGDSRLLVTNSCREMQENANGHGNPDPEWVGRNLSELWPFDLLLVCGKVAQQTYLHRPCGWNRVYPKVIYMDHPAARRWSNKTLNDTTLLIKRMLQSEEGSL